MSVLFVFVCEIETFNIKHFCFIVCCGPPLHTAVTSDSSSVVKDRVLLCGW